MKQTTRDTLLIEMAKLLMSIAIYGAGKYDSDSRQLDDLREAIGKAMKETEQEHPMDDFKYKEGDVVWYYDRDKKVVIPTRIVAVLRNTDHYYMLQYDPFTLRHEDNLFASEQELMAYLENGV
jgi:hypothetical protein